MRPLAACEIVSRRQAAFTKRLLASAVTEAIHFWLVSAKARLAAALKTAKIQILFQMLPGKSCCRSIVER